MTGYLILLIVLFAAAVSLGLYFYTKSKNKSPRSDLLPAGVGQYIISDQSKAMIRQCPCKCDIRSRTETVAINSGSFLVNDPLSSSFIGDGLKIKKMNSEGMLEVISFCNVNEKDYRADVDEDLFTDEPAWWIIPVTEKQKEDLLLGKKDARKFLASERNRLINRNIKPYAEIQDFIAKHNPKFETPWSEDATIAWAELEAQMNPADHEGYESDAFVQIISVEKDDDGPKLDVSLILNYNCLITVTID